MDRARQLLASPIVLECQLPQLSGADARFKHGSSPSPQPPDFELAQLQAKHSKQGAAHQTARLPAYYDQRVERPLRLSSLPLSSRPRSSLTRSLSQSLSRSRPSR
mmetsp:Transcript_21372/g.54388  ORF Transcript_21372/g.54388 Transcript_21372/m.54388 type:complete len:105 (+) Transcript_21372:74-388(+)